MVIDLEESKKALNVTVYATNNSIKVLNQDGIQMGSQVLSELAAEAGHAFTFVKVSGGKIFAALQGGLIKHYSLSLAQDGTSVVVTESSKLEMGAEVSAMCLALGTGLELIYVTLYDAPHFSLNVLATAGGQLRLLARMPLASVLESA